MWIDNYLSYSRHAARRALEYPIDQPPEATEDGACGTGRDPRVVHVGGGGGGSATGSGIHLGGGGGIAGGEILAVGGGGTVYDPEQFTGLQGRAGDGGPVHVVPITADDRTPLERMADHLTEVIAVANEALPDDDERKITRADVAALRADHEELLRLTATVPRADRLLAALELYLPEAT